MVVAGLITFIAAVHYMYMRDFWVATGESPTVYRYIDWILTVPLQMVEFFLILVAAGAAVSSGAFWRLLVGTLVMVVGGYLGEAGHISVLLGFIIGMIGWAVIIWEIFRGEASQAATTKESVTSAFNAMRLMGHRMAWPRGWHGLLGEAVLVKDALGLLSPRAEHITPKT